MLKQTTGLPRMVLPSDLRWHHGVRQQGVGPVATQRPLCLPQGPARVPGDASGQCHAGPPQLGQPTVPLRQPTRFMTRSGRASYLAPIGRHFGCARSRVPFPERRFLSLLLVRCSLAHAGFRPMRGALICTCVAGRCQSMHSQYPVGCPLRTHARCRLRRLW